MESFKNRVDRLFATMDSWETGNWRHWAKPAAYMMLSVVLSGVFIYGTMELREYVIEKATVVVETQGEVKPFEDFILHPSEVDTRPVTKDASLFPNQEGILRGNMKDGLVVYRLYPEMGMALEISSCGEENIYYEFGIFAEGGELLKGNFWHNGNTVLEFEEGKTYYIYVRDETEVTEDIVFMYFWQDPEWVKEYRATHSEGE